MSRCCVGTSHRDPDKLLTPALNCCMELSRWTGDAGAPPRLRSRTAPRHDRGTADGDATTMIRLPPALRQPASTRGSRAPRRSGVPRAALLARAYLAAAEPPHLARASPRRDAKRRRRVGREECPTPYHVVHTATFTRTTTPRPAKAAAIAGATRSITGEDCWACHGSAKIGSEPDRGWLSRLRTGVVRQVSSSPRWPVRHRRCRSYTEHGIGSIDSPAECGRVQVQCSDHSECMK